jgi:spermidine/putrescine transport system permease protein
MSDGTHRLWLAVLIGILAFMLLPLVLVVLFSFSANPVINFPITGLTLDWYGKLASNQEFWKALSNSLVIAASVAAISAITGTMAALGLLKLPPRLAAGVLTALSVPVMLPPLVIAIALVALYVRLFGVPLSLATVIGGHLLITQPFVALIVMARMATFDKSCLDAARDLGATPWQTFVKVTLPQIRTAIIGAALIAAAISLDDFIIALFTIGGGNTLSTFVWGKLRTTLDPSINAIATVLIVLTTVTTILALKASRYRG